MKEIGDFLKKFIIYWLPVLVWAGMIYYASSQPYEKQDLRPTISDFLNLDFVESLFSTTVFNYAGEEISIESMGAAHFIEFFIRKGAHFSVYLGLGFLLYRAFTIHLNNRLTVFLLSWILTIIYAISDEIHQGFTPNRTPLMEDVIIDTVGGLVGISLALFFYKNIRRKRI